MIKLKLHRLLLTVGLSLAIPVMATACGPSSAELKRAREAQYNLTGKQMFDLAMQVTQRNYKVVAVGDTGDWFATYAKWYNPDGASITAGAAGNPNGPNGSINVSLNVRVISDGTTSRVEVKAEAKRYKAGMSALETFNDNDLSKPGWVNGKANTLAHEIWLAARKYEIVTPGGTTPTAAPPTPEAPAPAPAPATDGTAPAAPAAPATN